LGEAANMSTGGVITALLVASAFGCSGSPAQPSWDGRVRVSGTVRDFATNAAVSAATVAFGNAGAGEITATADAGGAYSLTALEGMYHVTINGESITDVTLRDPNYRGDFFIRLTDCVGRYGMVLDSRTRQPVSGATLTFGSDPYATTDQTGWFQQGMGLSMGTGMGCVRPPFPTGACGFNTYFLSITHPRYQVKPLESSRGFCFVRRIDVELEPNPTTNATGLPPRR
jgi:hypothetical protein